MSRKPYSLSKQLAVAMALALGTSGVALADDSSMSRLGGDSYAYFNQPVPRNVAASPNWRQSHPNGLTDHELQALSSSGLAASAPSASSLAIWQAPNGSADTATASIDQATVAQTPSKETFAARLAKFFHPNGAPAGTQW